MIATRPTLAAAMLAALAACSDSSPPAGRESPSAGNLASSAPASRATPSSGPAGTGCAAGFDVDLDRSETAQQDWKAFPAERLTAFRGQAALALSGAADAACRAEPKLAAALKPVRRILVQSGAGAAEPTFYEMADGPPGVLVFQYAFAEAKLELPKREAIERGLTCWAAPDRKDCEDIGD